ncbi:MAG TPA: glycosyltransferase family 87 protein, partial [Ktedonobacterales bacterium]|nr:glycosyltransferase family 87 protein [Ktedonobacterales bacterium]
VLRWVALLALGALALPCYAAILQVAGTFLKQPQTLFWPLLGATLLYVAGCWLVLRSFPAASRRARWIELGLILAAGLAARAVFWGTPPLMSPDAYRYVWDAHLLVHGVSPYTHSPFDPAVQSLRDQAIWPNVRYRHDPTIYPPGAEMLFVLIYLIKPLSMGALKAGLEVCDALVAVLTMLLLRRHGLDLRRVIVYWWSPIPIIEFAFNQHLDVAVIVWILASLLVMGMGWRGARGAAGVLMGMATLTKLYPALYAVVMVRRRRDWVFLAGLVGTAALVYLAFWPFHAQSGGFLSSYVQQSAIDRGIGLVWLTSFVTSFGGGETQIIVAQVVALAALGLLIGWFCWRKGLRQEAGVLAISVLWIVLSTHLFTWYIAVLLPLLALYLRAPMPSRRSAEMRPADLSGTFATPALATWLFTLLMPFTYVIFAAGYYHPQLFHDFFYLVFAVAALPLLTRRGRATLRDFLRIPVRPAMTGLPLAAPTEEDAHAIDQAQPAAGQPAR